MISPPHSTALEKTCVLTTPSERLNLAFQYAKDNVARCMRSYSLGWGMSNAPSLYTTVVGRDTGWICLGTDYVSPWFSPAALRIFRTTQLPSGKIVEFVDMESGVSDDYGLNISDNTPLYLWAVCHHWQRTNDLAFRNRYMRSVRRAADYIVRLMGDNRLLSAIPAGVQCRGIASWRNMQPDTVLAGEVTEINSLCSLALRNAAQFTGDSAYGEAAEQLAQAINEYLWADSHYALTRENGASETQLTGDTIFPVLCGIAPPDRARRVLDRLSQSDFWSSRGIRTVPSTDPAYHPSAALGLVGGVWPNLTLWYAAAIAPYDPDRALDALELAAAPAVSPLEPEAGTRITEFPEYFDGETGQNLGMTLSPWVAPTFIWAVLEGLLGLHWDHGTLQAAPHWPSGWAECHITNIPTKRAPIDLTLRR